MLWVHDENEERYGGVLLYANREVQGNENRERVGRRSRIVRHEGCCKEDAGP